MKAPALKARRLVRIAGSDRKQRAGQKLYSPPRHRCCLLFAAGYRSRDCYHMFYLMKKAFKTGDHVSWNSEAGRVSGTIVKVHRKDVNFEGYTHHASRDDPQFEIKSDRTDHVALHKAGALRHLRRP